MIKIQVYTTSSFPELALYIRSSPKMYFSNSCRLSMLNTLEGVEDCENVGGRNPEVSVGEKGEAPWDTQLAAQAQGGYYTCALLALSCVELFGSSEAKDPGQTDDDHGEGEDEDQRIVAHVDNVVNIVVVYPTPWHKSTNQLLQNFKSKCDELIFSLTCRRCLWDCQHGRPVHHIFLKWREQLQLQPAKLENKMKTTTFQSL